MVSPKHIFISFKSEEVPIATLLAEALKSKGYNMWYDKQIQMSQEWHGEIDRALNTAGAVIVLWSKKSMQSSWVKHEASQAMSLRIYLSIRVEEVIIDNPYERLQALDLYNWNGEENNAGFLNLLKALEKLMPKPVPRLSKVKSFFRGNIATIGLFMFALAAASLLIYQTRQLGAQFDTLQSIIKNIQDQNRISKEQQNHQEKLIQDVGEQTINQKRLIRDVSKQSVTLAAQAKKQDEVITNVQATVKSLNYRDYPLDSVTLQLFFSDSTLSKFKGSLIGTILLIDKSKFLRKNELEKLFDYKLEGTYGVTKGLSNFDIWADILISSGSRQITTLEGSNFVFTYPKVFSKSYSKLNNRKVINDFRDLNEKVVFVVIYDSNWVPLKLSAVAFHAINSRGEVFQIISDGKSRKSSTGNLIFTGVFRDFMK